MEKILCARLVWIYSIEKYTKTSEDSSQNESDNKFIRLINKGDKDEFESSYYGQIKRSKLFSDSIFVDGCELPVSVVKNDYSDYQYSLIHIVLEIDTVSGISIEAFAKLINGPSIMDQLLVKNKSYLFSWEKVPGNDSERLIEFLMQNFNIKWIKAAKINKNDDGKTIRITNDTNFLSLTLNIEKKYLFSWNDIPGNDNKRLIGFLKKRFDIEWADNAKIKKIDDGKTIKLSFENNFLSLKLIGDETKVILKIADVRTDEFIAKTEKNKLNIYEKNNVNLEIDDGRTDKFIVETENGELNIYNKLTIGNYLDNKGIIKNKRAFLINQIRKTYPPLPKNEQTDSDTFIKQNLQLITQMILRSNTVPDGLSPQNHQEFLNNISSFKGSVDLCSGRTFVQFHFFDINSLGKPKVIDADTRFSWMCSVITMVNTQSLILKSAINKINQLTQLEAKEKVDVTKGLKKLLVELREYWDVDAMIHPMTARKIDIYKSRLGVTNQFNILNYRMNSAENLAIRELSEVQNEQDKILNYILLFIASVQLVPLVYGLMVKLFGNKPAEVEIFNYSTAAFLSIFLPLLILKNRSIRKRIVSAYSSFEIRE